MLENHHVESQEKFQFLESDIIQLRTALKIQSEQSQLFERKLNNASSQNEAINRENKILREGKFNFFIMCLSMYFLSFFSSVFATCFFIILLYYLLLIAVFFPHFLIHGYLFHLF